MRAERDNKEVDIGRAVGYSAVFVIIVVICAAAQSTSFTLIGVTPQFTLAAVCAIGFVANERYGAVFGLLGGVLVYSLGQSGFSLSIVLYVICGYFCGAMTEYFLTKNLLSFMVYGALSGVAEAAFTLINCILYSESFSPGAVFQKIILPEYAAFLICIIPAYGAVNTVYKLIKGKKKGQRLR